MNKIRLRKKLENFLDVYNTPGVKPSDKANMLRKINEIEKQLDLPLTIAEKSTRHLNATKDYMIVEGAADGKAQNKIDVTDDIYLKRYRYNKKLQETILEMVTPDEREYINKFNDWYKKVEQKAKEKIEKQKIFPFIQSNPRRKVNPLEVIDFLNSRMTPSQISEKLCVTTSAVHYCINLYFQNYHQPINSDLFKEYNSAPGYDRWKGLNPEILAERLNEGIPKKEIASEYNMSQAHLSKLYKNFIIRKYKFKKEFEEFENNG